MVALISLRKDEPWRRRLFLPAYEVGEAARYARTNPQTVAYWHFNRGGLGPILPGKEKGQPLSYLELVEVAIVAVFRRLGLSLQRLRKTREYAQQTFKAEYPFAQLQFQTEGHHLLLELGKNEGFHVNEVILADEHGQTGWKSLIADRFQEFDYEHDVALIWHLAGRSSPVVIDPRIAAGSPQVKGIPTWVLKGRVEAGETLGDITSDFNLSGEDVIHALRFEGVEVPLNGE